VQVPLLQVTLGFKIKRISDQAYGDIVALFCFDEDVSSRFTCNISALLFESS
jgi:hypothetical protein